MKRCLKHPNAKWITRTFLLLAGVLLIALPACLVPREKRLALPAEVTFSVQPVNQRLSPDQPLEPDDPLLLNPADRKIHLYAAGGETVAFQLVIPPSAADSLTLRIEPMTLVRTDRSAKETKLQTVETARWRVYQLLAIPTAGDDAFDARAKKPALLPARTIADPMAELPFETPGQVRIPRAEQGNILLWLEVDIPRQTARADYLGRIVLDGGRKQLSRDLVLHTWNFDLPDPGVDLVGLVDVPEIWLEHRIGSLRDSSRLILPPDNERIQTLAERIGPYCRILDENGVEPWLTRVYPKIAGTDPARLSVEWSGYQRLVQVVLASSSHGRKYWPAPVDLSYPSTQVFGPYASPLYRRVLETLLREFNEKCIQPGLLGKPVAVPAWPQNYEHAVTIYPACAALMKEWHRSEQPLTIIDPFIPTDLRPFGWANFTPFDRANSLAGGFCPDEQWLDPSLISQWRKEGKLGWWRTMHSEGSIPAPRASYPGYFPQALAWTGWKYGSTGIVLGEVNNWSASKKSGQAGENTPDRSPNVLIYPGSWFGREKPLGSVRLKLMRRGLQDIAYMEALKKAGQADLAEWLTRHLVRFAHADAFDGSLWTLRNDGLCNSDRAWMLPRLIAGFELSRSTVKGSATQRAESDNSALLRKLFTSQFRQLTEGLALEAEGVRAKNVLDLATGAKKIEWTFNLVTRNFTDKLNTGSLEFTNITEPLHALDDKVEQTDLNWAWPVRSSLKLETPSAAIGPFGVSYQPVTLTLSDHSEYTLNCRYCALAAERSDRPIRIDGEFDDWSENDVALAGDFRRIWPDGLNGQKLGEVNRNALWPTTVQVGYDHRNLYLAFTCYQPKESLTVRSANTLQSSAGLPWGEDLVAVVLDPDNTPSLNPLDAYQIIVKANGNVLTFRGTLAADAMRASGTWPNHVRAAVKTLADRWQVELVIPLDDLNAAGKLDRWWGIDFARFAPAIGEFSTWSGTKNQYAKPVSMGNVFLAR